MRSSRCWLGVAVLLLAVFVYLQNIGSEHAATNPDELLYLQITRLTADSGQWLPLQSEREKHRNTKPPALFWQGMVSTDGGENWDLWHLRYPNALYTLAIAGMVFLLGRRFGEGNSTGLVGALVYLAFFGVYRHGPVLLTSAPETFWLFSPLFALLYFDPKARGLSWPWAIACGLMIGLALLYKSFALVIPPVAVLSWWGLRAQDYRLGLWLRSDFPKLMLMSGLALGIFALWFVLDPERHLIFNDFVWKENVGKITTGGNYLANLLWGKHSIWSYSFGWLTNAGLLAPAVLSLFGISFLRRSTLSSPEKKMWILLGVFFFFFIPFSARYERYLLPAMPAVAVLCALRWREIPRWTFRLTLVTVLLVAVGLGLLAAILMEALAGDSVYSWTFWLVLGGTMAVPLFGLFRSSWTRDSALASIFLLYALYGAFLEPLNGPRGQYDSAVRQEMRGQTVMVPRLYNGRDELYRFLLPASEVRDAPFKKTEGVEKLMEEPKFLIISRPFGDDSLDQDPKLRVVGTRLNFNQSLRGPQVWDILRGNLAPNLFAEDVILEVLPSQVRSAP